MTSSTVASVGQVDDRAVPQVHPDAAVQKVAGRWMAMTVDQAVHSFEEDDGQVSEVGERILELVDGARTVGEIVDVLVDEFEVPREVCAGDTRQFIGLLIQKKVLTVSGK